MAAATTNNHAYPAELSGLEALQNVRKINAALLEDAECRHPGVTAGLYGLADLAPFARLGHGVPIVRSSRHASIFNRALSDEDFRLRLETAAPFLATFGFQAHGIRLAGGAVCTLLMRQSDVALSQIADFDMFLVGHSSDESAKGAILALVSHLASIISPFGSLTVYRTQNCITIHFSGPLAEPGNNAVPPYYSAFIQIILRRYSTDGEVIHGFDLGSSAMMWDGSRVVLTGLGKLAAEHGANVLNLATRRASYESRISKYFTRGFDLVLPDLDARALVAAGGIMPYLAVLGARRTLHAQGPTPAMSPRCGCDVYAYAMEARWPGSSSRSEEQSVSAYSAADIPYGDRVGVTRGNIKAASRPKVRVAALCAIATYSALRHNPREIFEIEPSIDLEDFCRLVNGAIGRDPMPGGSTAVQDAQPAPRILKVDYMRYLLGPERSAAVAAEIIISGRLPSEEAVRRMCVDRLGELPPLKIPFAFMQVEENTALTGPFTRELVTKLEWYGSAMVGYDAW